MTPKELVSSNASLTHTGHGKKTKEWDGRGAHSYTDGMDSPPAQTQRENVLVSFACLRHAGQCITNFNGDGGEHSPTEKCRVEGQSGEDTKKVSFMSTKSKRR